MSFFQALLPPAGRYSIVGKQGSQTHLVWKLETPKELGDVQKDLCIGQEGSLSLSIKVCSIEICSTSQ